MEEKYVWKVVLYSISIKIDFNFLNRKNQPKKTDHFKPLWQKNVPKFGIAHAMALGLGPWLAVEVPDLVAKGLIKPV